MIQFAINKAYFLQALHTTRRAISSKNAIPILSTIKIEVTSEGIYLTGSNGQISIKNFFTILAFYTSNSCVLAKLLS